MDFGFKATNTPSRDMVDRVQQCLELLIEIEELGKQEEEHTELLAKCEKEVQQRKCRIVRTLNARQTATTEKTFESMQAKFVEHKRHVSRFLHNIKKLQSVYRELILESWRKDADSNSIRFRRQTLLTALHLVQDLHILITQNSGDIISRRIQKRSVQGRRRSQRNRKQEGISGLAATNYSRVAG